MSPQEEDPTMDNPKRSLMIYGLAGLCVLCAAFLAGRGTLTGEQFMTCVSTAFAAVGLAHMPPPDSPPRRALNAVPMPPIGSTMPTAGLLVLALLSACRADVDFFPAAIPGAMVRAAAPGILSTSITPITNLSGPASGFAYGGDSYEVSCTISGTATLYPVVHNGTAWEPPYMGYGCALDSTLVTKGTCIFPARTEGGLTWNAFKTGSGSVSGCTATGRQGPVPSSRSSGGGSSSGGTVTSVGLAMPSEFSVSGSPVTTSGTLTASWASPVTIAHGGTNSGTALSNNRLMCSSGGAIVECSAATNGQIPIGSTGALPVFATPAVSNGLSWAGGAGSATLSQTFGTDATHAAVGNDNRFPPAPSSAGRILYDNGSAWTALAAGTSGQALLSGGAGAPTWGSAGLSTTLWWSPALAAQALAPAGFPNTNITFGQPVIPTAVITATGARMYWTASTGTLKFTLWDPSGTAVATGTVAVASIPQLVSVNFGTPYTIPSNLLYQEFIISVFETTGSHDCDGFVGTDLNPPTVPGVVGAGVMINQINGIYTTSATEAFPTTSASATVAIDLLWTVS